MPKKDDGGPAFPTTIYEPEPAVPGRLREIDHPGMSLRDWFAGQAAAQLVPYVDAFVPLHAVAKSAYKFADAMLAEREKDNE